MEEDLKEKEEELVKREEALKKHHDSRERDIGYIENLKRKLDHEIRERKSHFDIVEKELEAKRKELMEKEKELAAAGRGPARVQKVAEKGDVEGYRNQIKKLENATIKQDEQLQITYK